MICIFKNNAKARGFQQQMTQLSQFKQYINKFLIIKNSSLQIVQTSKIMNIKKSNVYLYPLDNKVVFPYHQYTFTINSNLYDPDTYDNLIGFVTKSDDLSNKSIQTYEGYSRFGTLLKIHKSDISGYRISQNKKIYSLNLIGLTFARFRVLSLVESDGKIISNIQIFSDQISKEMENLLEKKSLISNLKKQMKTFYECKLKFNESELKKQLLDAEKSINKMIYKCADQLDLPAIQKLKILQMHKHDIKMQTLLIHLKNKTQNIKSIVDIEEKVRQDMSKAVKKTSSSAGSLGGKGGFFGGQRMGKTDTSDIQEKINSKNLPPHVKQQIQKEMKRMGGQTQSAVSLKYIETLLQIPWMQSNEEVKDISAAQKILNDDHTGLKEVKQRILQFLAVKFKNGNSKGNIICLHGPPGVGKTSIAKSIAKSLGRQFTRVSLGGMHDQAQLRGHRRTYVAALPGVIIRALMKAKSNNPVILLDEIQKIGKSYKGDPEHALLQILDPSQNSSFIDHYVSIPVDLSKVMFICTANSLQLSTPLLNRLQLIEVPGYTREQKFEIAKNHLLPIQIKQNGVTDQIQFEEDALKQIVRYSTQMGVRQLQRKIAKICRKVARKNKPNTKEKITLEKVQEFLGKRHKSEKWKGIGVVNGMAWTAMGGKLLMVESISYPNNKGKIQITGQLGDVMKQSVNIALSWIKAHINDFDFWGASNLKLKEKLDDIQKTSIHIHFPEGATKKDGPSAGVTIVTSFLSLFLKMPVRQNLSMTGEITLSGRVLPVGGIRQKCIAAIYQGIEHIIIPFGNIKDLQKIQPQIRKKVQFYPVKQLKQVLSVAFPTLWQAIPPKL